MIPSPSSPSLLNFLVSWLLKFIFRSSWIIVIHNFFQSHWPCMILHRSYRTHVKSHDSFNFEMFYRSGALLVHYIRITSITIIVCVFNWVSVNKEIKKSQHCKGIELCTCLDLATQRYHCNNNKLFIGHVFNVANQFVCKRFRESCGEKWRLP